MTSADQSPENAPDRDGIEHTAAEWILREQQGLTAGEKRSLEHWLSSDHRNAAIYFEMRETSELLDQLRDPVFAPPAASSGEMSNVQGTFVEHSRPAPRRAASWFVPALLGAAAAIAIGTAAWVLRSSRAERFVQVVATDVGGWRKLDLPDGSSVQLNTDTAVEIQFSANERRVRLARGEAFFNVAKDSARPFQVEAGEVAVRAIGTAFNVRHRQAAVEVLVTEGKVRLNSAKAALVTFASSSEGTDVQPRDESREVESFLVAGQKAVVASVGPAQPRPVLAIDAIELPRIGRALAWQERRIEFADSPLSDVVAEFNRYNHHKLVIADSTLATRTFGGAFNPNGYEALIEILEQSFGIVAERQANQTLLRTSR